jgi:hypothetical protein
MQAMLSDAGMNRKWWGECLPQATYISNITQSNGEASAWELVKGSKPSIDTLHTFGCAVWVHVPAELRGPKKNLPPKSVCGRYLGYDFPNLTAHRVLLPPASGRGKWSPWQSRHALFDESQPAASQPVSLEVDGGSAALPAAEPHLLPPAAAVPTPVSLSQVPAGTPQLGSSPLAVPDVRLSTPATVPLAPAPVADPPPPLQQNPLYSEGSLSTIHEGDEGAAEDDQQVTVTPPALPVLQSSNHPTRHKDVAWRDRLPYSGYSMGIAGASVFRLRSAQD